MWVCFPVTFLSFVDSSVHAVIARDYTWHCAVFRPLQRLCCFPLVSCKSLVFLWLEINGRSIQPSSYARQRSLPPFRPQPPQTILFVPKSKHWNNNNLFPNLKITSPRNCGNKRRGFLVLKRGDLTVLYVYIVNILNILFVFRYIDLCNRRANAS